MYDDDGLFAGALGLLERTFAQRRKLLEAVQNVTLLNRPTMPIFGNFADMNAELGYLIYLIRSTEVWAVCSRISGPFVMDNFQQVLLTLERINQFLYSPSVVTEVGDARSKLAKQTHQSEWDIFDGIQMMGTRVAAVSEDRSPGASPVPEQKTSEESKGGDDGDESDDEAPNGESPNPHHQGILRAMNMHSTLLEVLTIDYNLAFKGSICTSEEKLQSREILVTTLRKFNQVIVEFIRGNKENQCLIFEALPELERHLGLLKVPTFDEHFDHSMAEQIPTDPGLGVEQVIIECLRGNEYLCDEKVPRDLFEDFAQLLNNEPDISASPLLEIFTILCIPEGTPNIRNQEYTVDVFTSEILGDLRATIQGVFGVGSVLCSSPEKIVRLICATIEGHNASNAMRLQSIELSMDNAIAVANKQLAKVQEQCLPEETARRNRLLLQDEYFMSMLELLHLQMAVLVLDPRMFRRDDVWGLLTVGVTGVLQGFADGIEDRSVGGPAFLAFGPAVLACLRTVKRVVDGANRLGMQEQLKFHEVDLSSSSNEGSIAESCKRILLFLRGRQLPNQRPIDYILGVDEPPPKAQLPKSTRPLRWEICYSALKVFLALRPDRQNLPPPTTTHQLSPVNSLQPPGRATKEIVAPRGLISLLGDDDEDRVPWEAVAKAHHSPVELFDFFVEALKNNRRIQNRLQARRFEFVQVLEKSSETTDPAKRRQQARPRAPRNEDASRNSLGARVPPLPPRGRLASEIDEIDEDFDEPHKGRKIGNIMDVGRGVGGAFKGFGGAIKDAFEDAIEDIIDIVNDSDSEEDFVEVFGVQIAWGQLVKRMVRYAKAHNFDVDETSCIRVYNAFKNHLFKARSDENAEVRYASDMDQEELAEYRRHQSALNEEGVTRVALDAISTHSSGVEDNSGGVALDLLMELLYSGNMDVQAAVHEYIVDVDKDAKFLKHLRARLILGVQLLKERNETVAYEFVQVPVRQREEYDRVRKTLMAVQSLMEGHNLRLQNLVRSQPMHAADINLLKIMVEMLVIQSEEPILLKRMENIGVEMLVSTLDAIIESMQGPCHGNQLFVVKSDALVAIKNIIPSTFTESNKERRVDRRLRMKVKAKAVAFLAAALEGRKDKDVHEVLAEQVEWHMLITFSGVITRYIHKVNARTDMPEEKRQELAGEAVEGLVALQNIQTELRLIPSFRDSAKDLDLGESSDVKAQATDKRVMRSRVGSVEVFWNGHIEYVSFPLPQETEFLSSTSKQRFMEIVDLSTAEKRVKELIKEAPHFIAEMKQVFSLARSSKLYEFMHHNLTSIKMLQYALVILLNLNVIMASYGQDLSERHGYDSAAEASVGTEDIRSRYRNSLYLTWALGIPNFVGYFFIMGFLGITEVPIIIRQIDDRIEHYKMEVLDDPDTPTRNPDAWTWWGVTLVFNIMFIVMHIFNYPGDPDFTLYYVLVFGINLPWTLLCVRNYIAVPDTERARWFCIVFDSIVTKPFMRNHLLLLQFSVQGFFNSEFFTLMLLDVVNISTTLQDIVKSVTKPAAQLGIVAYTFVITVVIYAHFGLTLFEDSFVYDPDADDDDPVGCHSVVSCFWLILYQGVPAGSMENVQDVINNRDPDYLNRVVYDLSFFILVGILLFNVITGLMVDTFSALREEAAERADTLTNECFICGFHRAAYDDVGILSPTFDNHVKADHNVWNYLYFVMYLRDKDETEFSGVETYVQRMLHKSDQNWIPSRTSFAVEHYKAETARHNAMEQQHHM